MAKEIQASSSASTIKPEMLAQRHSPSSPLSSDVEEDNPTAAPDALSDPQSSKSTRKGYKDHSGSDKPDEHSRPNFGTSKNHEDSEMPDPNYASGSSPTSGFDFAKQKSNNTEIILNRPFQPFDQLASIGKLEESEKEDVEFEQGLLSFNTYRNPPERSCWKHLL